MSEWKCGKCGTVYDHEGFMALCNIPVVADDPDPKKNYGYAAICSCGYRFHLDKWFMRSTGTIIHHMTIFHNLFYTIFFGRYCKPYEIEVNISTVDLELNHEDFGGEPLYYESMIFPSREDGEVECWYQDRYPIKEWANADHQHLRYLLERGKYLITYRWDSYNQKFVWLLDISEKNNRISPKTTLQEKIITMRPDPTFAQQQALRKVRERLNSNGFL